MSKTSVATIADHFANIEDPRVERTREHALIDIMVIAICAVICGANHWTEVELFGQAKKKWFQTFLKLANGIPSHDTFGRVFASLDPKQFQASFLNWIQSVSQLLPAEVVAIDGKVIRRSHDRGIGKEAIHMVSAWATANRIVLGQRKVAEKSNEITAIPELLQALALSGCIVTIDAMGCQTEIVQTIIEQGADYVLALKGNQGNLSQDVQEAFAYGHKTNFEQVIHDYHKTVGKGHGRLEIRECWTMPVAEWCEHIRHVEAWANWQTMVMVKSQRQSEGETTEETRFFISSLGSNAQELLAAVRTHWEIENGLHWVLDVAFREDESRIRKGFGQENFALLRHIALNLLKQDKSTKVGIKSKRLKAGWDETYLLSLLTALT
jgi:predicted transposase YbfD/YdcC